MLGNAFGIPSDIEQTLRERDQQCVGFTVADGSSGTSAANEPFDAWLGLGICIGPGAELRLGGTEERCQVIINYHVAKGEIDGVDVSGHSVSVVADAPPKMPTVTPSPGASAGGPGPSWSMSEHSPHMRNHRFGVRDQVVKKRLCGGTFRTTGEHLSRPVTAPQQSLPQSMLRATEPA